MAAIKSFTDLEQSKKLAEILPLESADMVLLHEEPYETSDSKFDGLHQALCVPFNKYDKSWRQKYKNISYFPCWSLSALLGVLPSRLFDSTPKRKELYLLPDLDKSYCFYRQFAVKTKGKIYLLTEGECLVDACVAMIEKLHELKML